MQEFSRLKPVPPYGPESSSTARSFGVWFGYCRGRGRGAGVPTPGACRTNPWPPADSTETVRQGSWLARGELRFAELYTQMSFLQRRAAKKEEGEKDVQLSPKSEYSIDAVQPPRNRGRRLRIRGACHPMCSLDDNATDRLHPWLNPPVSPPLPPRIHTQTQKHAHNPMKANGLSARRPPAPARQSRCRTMGAPRPLCHRLPLLREQRRPYRRRCRRNAARARAGSSR